jgi:hypothetical protein
MRMGTRSGLSKGWLLEIALRICRDNSVEATTSLSRWDPFQVVLVAEKWQVNVSRRVERRMVTYNEKNVNMKIKTKEIREKQGKKEREIINRTEIARLHKPRLLRYEVVELCTRGYIAE